MCHALTQGIRTIKTFIKYKSATAGKFITKKTQVSSVECWDHCDDEIKNKLVKSKVLTINYPYFAKKIEFLL